MPACPNRLALVAVISLVGFASSCTSPKKEEPPAPVPAAAPAPAPVETPDTAGRVAIAELSGPEGSSVQGVVTFRDTGNGVAIEAKVSGLTPGAHGFHVHEKGECSGDFTSAGPHFNPGGHAHAGPDAAEAHSGDLGNLRATPEGNAQITMLSRRFTLDESATGILGRAVIVHEKEDDLATQPTGNSGARIACGVTRLQEGTVTSQAAAPADAAAAAAPAEAAPAGSANH